ncbi:hypothetical protein ABPG72_011740 [Tetrahymena utriculariae]
MEKYINLEVIGKGSFGEVVKAQNKETKEIVAIKTMKQKFVTWEECMNLRELKSLRKLVNKNIVKLKEVLRVQNQLSFVFEYLDTDIYKLYENQKKLGQRLSETQLRSIFYQLAQSLSYMHKHGYFHRDLKPENILYSNKDGYVKLTDFGLAREIRSRPPYTDYVATRWYRAPELILRATNYNSPVDIFALGCIMAELYMFKPLFNGSSELDQLQKMTSVLGTPSKLDWPEGYRLAGLKGITFPSYPAIPLNQVITDCPYEAVSLIAECLKWDPQKRPTASKILQHPYFKGVESVLPAGYFNDQEEIKVNQQQTIHQGSGNPSNNDLNVSFGNEDSSKQVKRNSFSLQSGQQQVLTNKDNSPNNTNNLGGNPLLKKLSNQFSQSDVSITNKLKGTNNFPHSDYKSAKALELDTISEISNIVADPSQGKPPLNPNKISRQNNRNQILKNQENTTPSFNDRAKGKESGFNYSEFSSILDNRQQNNNSASKQQRATSLQQNNNDFFFGNHQQNQNNNSNNYNTSLTSPSGNVNQTINSSTSNNNIYNFANVNVNGRNQSPSLYPYSNNNNNKLSNNNEFDSDKNDILGTYLPSSINSGGSNHQARGSYHNYSNTQPHPRQQQQISSAVEKRSSNSIPYNTINYNGNQGNANNSGSIHNAFNGGIYQSSVETGSRPTRNLNSAAYFENKANSYNNQEYNSQSVNGSYRDYQNNNNTNNMRNFYGNSPSHFSDNSGYIPSAAQGGSNTGGNNYSSNNTNNIYSFSAAINSNNGAGGGYSLSNPVYGVKSNQTSSTTTNANALTNKNIYDFNHVRQPVRNLGLPGPKFDIKF